MKKDYRRTKATVSMINYHFVFCPRYRRKLFLVDGFEARFKELVTQNCEQNDIVILAMECHIDHCHLFVNAPPTLSATNAKTGRAHTKKRFGKSLSRCAPAMFISILNKKANRYGGSVIKVSTFETKASQFDHTDESHTKKRLSERMARLHSGEVVQRDLYSAFLLEHIDIESLQYNMETLNSAFPAFLEMHENTKHRLQAVGSSLPASIGF